MVIDTIVSKYADHGPLYRQSVILERETGIEMPRATLDAWVMRVGELLRPITAVMGQMPHILWIIGGKRPQRLPALDRITSRLPWHWH